MKPKQDSSLRKKPAGARPALWTAAAAMAGLVGCGGGADDGRNPMGSQAMVTSADYKAVYVASPDDGVVARVSTETSQVTRTEVPGEPTRVTRVGDRVLVTQRAARAVLELRDNGGQLEVVRSVDVGAEPYGIAATEDGTRVYLTESTNDRLIELDGESLETLRAWDLPGEPRWLALHPSGSGLYVGAFRPGTLYFVNLDTGAATQVALPSAQGFDPLTGAPAELTPRVTGDLAASPNGKWVAVPTLYIDNETPLVEPDPENPEPMLPDDGYGGRLNPTVVMIETHGDGSPKAGQSVGVALNTFEVAGYPSSVTFSPSSKAVVVTMEGAAAICMFATEVKDGFFDVGVPEPTRGGVGFEHRGVTTLLTPEGPRAVAFHGDNEAFVYGFLDREVAPIPSWVLTDFLEFGGTVGDRAFGVKIAESNLSPEVEEGRRLFYASNDPLVSAPGSGVSCATCHFDGRDDGITWNFERGPRQTPSLAGMVSSREPVRWEGDKATVAEDALSTSQGLMGGSGLSMTAAEKIAAFIDYTREVDHPGLGSDDAAVQRGKQIFEREDVACGSCHSGALFTDKQTYTMFGFEGVKTPSLLGVAATAPYLHDGSAATLRAVLDAARSGVMGDTSSLSEAEMADLEAYLRSL